MPSVLRRCVLAFISVGIFGCGAAALAGERAKAALEEATTVTLVNMPLKDLAAFFRKTHKVEFAIADGLPKDLPITGVIHRQKLREALEILLKPSKLTFRADGDRIVVEPEKGGK